MDALDACQVFVLWPEPIRRRVEGEALFSLARDVAEELFAPAFGRMPEPVTVRAAMVAEELPPLPEDERAEHIQAVKTRAAGATRRTWPSGRWSRTIMTGWARRTG